MEETTSTALTAITDAANLSELHDFVSGNVGIVIGVSLLFVGLALFQKLARKTR